MKIKFHNELVMLVASISWIISKLVE